MDAESEDDALRLLPFFVGTCLCLVDAWRARRTIEGTLPFAILMVMLVSNMSGNWIATPLLWLAFAYALAGGRRPALAT